MDRKEQEQLLDSLAAAAEQLRETSGLMIESGNLKIQIHGYEMQGAAGIVDGWVEGVAEILGEKKYLT